MATIKDSILSQIPGHIIESYPRFYQFLEAYYEWLHQEGNPYERVKYHLDYLDFQKSMDDYVDFMKNEYLRDVPNSVLLDKELFIKWSKKFNLARGSHASYKFLFKLLFNEQTTEIYVPKENILRTSDGEWISGESRMILTNTAPISAFTFQLLEQEKEIAPGEFEYAYASIQNARVRTQGRYNVIELTVTDIDGTFEPGYQVRTEAGGEAWLIDTIQELQVDSPGTNYQFGDRVVFESLDDYKIEREAEEDGSFDTRVTTLFKDSQITVEVNSSAISDFEFDGRTVTSSSINDGDTVTVFMPAYVGYLSVSEVDSESEVIELSIEEAPIGTHKDYSLSIDSYGNGFSGTAVSGLIGKVNGYYKNNKGQLSSNMYLQDGFYYQEYSYAIQTMEDISKYGDIVKNLLHPAGFQMFGIMNISELIEILLALEEHEENILATELYSFNKYSLGPNYSFFDRYKAGLSKRLYRMYHFRDEAINAEYFEDGVIEDGFEYVRNEYPIRFRYDSNQMVGDDGYNLEDGSLERTYTGDGFFDEYYFDNSYMMPTGKFSVQLDGWMTKHNFVDYHLYLPQDYSKEIDSGNTYFETGFVTERT